ncbi:MAG: hypothetical protein ABIM42_06245 [candidate division WOR-3 bacterium]
MEVLLIFLFTLPKYFYSVSDTVTLKVVVMDVFVDKIEGSEAQHVALRVSSPQFSQEKIVVLGPPWFLEDLPRKGDTCEVKGSIFKSEDTELIVARVLYNFRTKNMLELRSLNGFPLWMRREGTSYRERTRVRGEFKRGKPR